MDGILYVFGVCNLTIDCFALACEGDDVCSATKWHGKNEHTASNGK